MIKSALVYGISFFISLILCYIYEKKIDKSIFKNRIIWTLLIIAPTVIIAGIRFNIGYDYLEYERQFYENKLNNLQFYLKEPLNMILMMIVYYVARKAVIMFFVYSFITMFVAFRAIDYYRDRLSITLSLFIFYMVYYLISYNIIRQMIAVVIILYGTRYIFEKKFWKYFLCTLIATGIHKTAVLMIILYWFNDDNIEILKNIKFIKSLKLNFKETIKPYIVYIFIAIIPFVLLPIIPKLISMFGIYRSYLSRETSLSLDFMLYILPILWIVLIKRDEIIQENKSNDFFIKMLILQIPFQLMGGFIKYFDRYSLYPAITQIILIPILYKNLSSSKFNKCVKLGIISWYTVYFVGMFFILKSNGTVPYTTLITYWLKEF